VSHSRIRPQPVLPQGGPVPAQFVGAGDEIGFAGIAKSDRVTCVDSHSGQAITVAGAVPAATSFSNDASQSAQS
jgi:hypothetical protein